MVAKAFFEPIRTLGFAGISAVEAPVGAVTVNEVRTFTINNATEGDLYFSLTSGQDEMFLAKGNFRLYDVQSNINPRVDDRFVLSIGTQFYVRQVTAPVSGAVYIECLC